MQKISLVLCLALSGLTGCASIISGTKQSVNVSTAPVTGAICTLENNKGNWYVPATPATVTVHRSYENLNIACNKKGYGKAYRSVSSSTKPVVFGNVLLGGPVGGAVDIANGSAYDYPQNIHLDFRKG